MKINRRRIIQLVAAIPLLGWIDTVGQVAQSAAAKHYRLKGDGRSLYKLLRDHVRNGIDHVDLERICGPFRLCGPVENNSAISIAEGHTCCLSTDVDQGHFFIEYPMSYWFVRLEIKDGRLVNHNPSWYEDYPDGLLVCEDGTLHEVSRPLDEGPLDNPPETYNPEFDS